MHFTVKGVQHDALRTFRRAPAYALASPRHETSLELLCKPAAWATRRDGASVMHFRNAEHEETLSSARGWATSLAAAFHPTRALPVACARERRGGGGAPLCLCPMRSLQLSAQFGGQGQGFASRLERALAGDDAGVLLELQLSALEELDCAPTDALPSGGARLDGWCHELSAPGGALTEPLCTAVAVFAAQASNFALFCRLVQGAALPFSAHLGHSQGLANAVLASAGANEQAYTALARCARRKRARGAQAAGC